MSAIKVGIVEDNTLTQQILVRLCDRDPRLAVVGTASNTDEARAMIKSERPDVLTLDIDLPGTNGLTFLHNLMRLNRMPVVIVSSYIGVETSIELNSLSLGAVDVLPKPPGQTSLAEYQKRLIDSLVAAAEQKTEAGRKDRLNAPDERVGNSDLPLSSRAAGLIAIGASTGGTEAIKTLLASLPVGLPPILIAQHLPGTFARSFADNLDAVTPIYVMEACDGLSIQRGHAYCAPADQHILVGSDFRIRLRPRSSVDEYCPLVDRLFESALRHFGTQSAGVLLTGMGSDGAKQLLEMRRAGALTIAQDEASSVVWGMPGSAVEMGAARFVLSLDEIPEVLSRAMAPLARKPSRERSRLSI